MNASTQLAHFPETVKTSSVAGVASGFQLKKWGTAGKAGFQIVPNVLLRAQQLLELDASDVVILLNLSLHWWSAENLPSPSPRIIANRMGVSKRTVERRLGDLEKREFLKRLPATDDMPRKYDLSGFVQKLESAAAAGIAQRAYRKARAAGTKKFGGA